MTPLAVGREWAAAGLRLRSGLLRIKRIAEQTGAGGQAALEVFREDEKASERRERQRLLLEGPVTMGAGLGLMLFFAAIAREPVWLIGAIPFLVGLAMLICGLAFGSRRWDATSSSENPR